MFVESSRIRFPDTKIAEGRTLLDGLLLGALVGAGVDLPLVSVIRLLTDSVIALHFVEPHIHQEREAGIAGDFAAGAALVLLLTSRELLPQLAFAVARAYAGHAGGKSEGSTVIYTRASLEEVALALAPLTGQPHPLAAAT
ncbi:hypothetical protein HLB23_14075 [Nocardia uniformis]|uniref:Uncharacterized protein n=1 Tax=Nocardia uniformis TaxID=53432 RepID=A0A849C0J3_9NOCA|nr:hypothetical protein [Nocardia uniformis]NNH70976.1 hypothetical protein [Nocardia uniformis]